MQIWIHDSKMRKIVALNNDIPDMLSYTNSAWHPYLDQATSTFDFTIPKFSNGELHEDIKLINDECFVSFYVNGSYQVFYIATLQEDDFNIQLTCNNTNLEYALEYANPFSSDGAQSIEWYLENLELLSFAAVEIGINEISDRKRTLTFDSQETKMNRLQSLMSKFEAEFEFKVELNRDGTYKRITINIYQKDGIGTDRKDVVLYYSNGLKGVQVNSDKTQMFNAGVFTGKDGLTLADVEFSEKNADGVEEFYSRKDSVYTYAPLSKERYPSTMQPESTDNWTRKDFTTEYENVNDLKAYAIRTLKQYAYPLVTYTASVQSGFVSQYTDLKLGDTIRIIDKNFAGGLALEARVSEMIISFDNPANNSFVFTNYRKLDNKPSSALQMRIDQAVESKLPYRIELATTGGVTFKNNEGETIIKPSLYKGNLPWTKDVTWHWTLNSIVTDGMQYRIQARDITDTAVLTVDAFVGGNKVATTEITLTNINDGAQGPQGDEGPQGPQGDEGPKGDKGDTGNGIANTVVTYGLSMSDTTEPATWSSSVPTLVKGMYLWTRTVIIYTNGESTTSYQISYIAKDADATAAIDKTKQELLEKLDTVRNDSLAAVEEAKQELTTVADDLSQAKQDLTSQAQQLQAQASAQSELTKRVSSVEETANGTKTTVSELSKTVAQNGKDITSVTARTKVVEDDLTNTKATLTQVQTTANSTSQKTATLETGLNGVKADLTATTTTANTIKTNLANYQASNDRAVANLQSNMQTANGDISSLKTKVEAVPGQITSAVSAVESKIPTSSGGRNLALYTSADWSDGWTYFTGQKNQVSQLYRIYNRGFKIGDKINVRIVLKYNNIVAVEGQTPSGIAQCPGNVTIWGRGGLDSGRSFIFDGSNGEIELKGTVVVDEYIIKNEYWDWQLRVDYVASGKIQWKEAKAEAGDLPTPWSAAPEDTAEQISSLSSKIKQTADGITLLATKTELNTAKSELQSGINTATNKANNAQAKANNNAQTISTHTTQISALNTGLNAKVSQTDFNILSGRVTSAENNITAKANELSSKISSVEGKIPANLDSLNLMTGTRDWSTKANKWHMGVDWSTENEEYQGLKVHSTQTGYNGSHQNIFVKNGDVVTFSFFAKATNTLSNIRVSSRWNGSSVYQGPLAGVKESDELITITSEWKRYSKTVHITSDGSLQFRTEYKGQTIPNGNTFYVAGLKLAKTSQDTGYSENLVDVASDISSLSSEFKQTTDAIKASVASLDNSTVKSSSLTINADGIVMKAGKSTSDFANAVGSYFSVNQNAINLFSDKINVKGNMIVSGAITSDKIAAGAITADKIAANSISSDKIVSSGITADVISGGVLKAANDAMQINLNSSNITFSEDASVIFTSSDNALKRVIPGKPSQFIKMCDSVFVSEIGELPDSTLTVIASNSDRTENIDSAGFGGMKIWNGSSSTDSTSFVELVGNRVAIYGNKNRSPWLFDMTTTTSSLVPQNSNGIKHSLGRGDRPFHSVYADNMYIQGERVAMMLKDIALYIGYKGNNGWVDRIS